MAKEIKGKQAIAMRHVLEVNGINFDELVANAKTVMESKFATAAQIAAEADNIERSANSEYQARLMSLQEGHAKNMSVVNEKRAAAQSIQGEASTTQKFLGRI